MSSLIVDASVPAPLWWHGAPEPAAIDVVSGRQSSQDPVIKRVTFSPDGTRLLAWHSSNELFVMNVPGALFTAAAPAGALGPPVSANRQPEIVYDACWYPYSQVDAAYSFLAVACKQQPVQLIESTTGRVRASFVDRRESDELAVLHSLAWRTDGGRLFAGGDAQVSVFDVARPGPPITRIHPHEGVSGVRPQRGMLSALAASPAALNLFACGSFDGSIWQYDDRSGRAVGQIRDPRSEAVCQSGRRSQGAGGASQLLYSADGVSLFGGFRRSDALVCWDLRKPMFVSATFSRDGRGSQRFYFDLDPSGETLMTGDAAGIVRAYDVRTAFEQYSLRGFPDAVGSVACHPGV
jgi:telomerase Cajal body protein 1